MLFQVSQNHYQATDSKGEVELDLYLYDKPDDYTTKVLSWGYRKHDYSCRKFAANRWGHGRIKTSLVVDGKMINEDIPYYTHFYTADADLHTIMFSGFLKRQVHSYSY